MTHIHKHSNIRALEEAFLENEKTFDGRKYLDEMISSMQNNMDSIQSEYALEYNAQKKELEKAQYARELMDQKISDELIAAFFCNEVTGTEKEMIIDRAAYDPSFLRELCEIAIVVKDGIDEEIQLERRKKVWWWVRISLPIILNIAFLVIAFVSLIQIFSPDYLQLNNIYENLPTWIKRSNLMQE